MCYQNVNDLEIAECVLSVLDLLQISRPELTLHPNRNYPRDTLANSCVTMEWRNGNVTRTKFRLSILLRAQNRPGEASPMREEIARILEDIRLAFGWPEYRDEDDMKLLGFEVSIFRGR